MPESIKERMARKRSLTASEIAGAITLNREAQPLSQEAAFQIQNQDRILETFEDVKPTNAPSFFNAAAVTHRRPDKVKMWKPSPQGFFPRTVPATNLGMLLKEGWSVNCPHCEGQHDADPNTCPGREPIKFARCPVTSCRKKIYDNLGIGNIEFEDEGDPNAVQVTYTKSTPESRLKAQFDLHMWIKHERTAQAMNIDPLPVAMRDMVQEKRPVGVA